MVQPDQSNKPPATYYFRAYYSDKNKDVVINCRNRDYSILNDHKNTGNALKAIDDRYLLMMVDYATQVIAYKQKNTQLMNHSFRLLFQYPSDIDTNCSIDSMILTNQGKIASSKDSPCKLKKIALDIISDIQKNKDESSILLRCHINKDIELTWSWFNTKSTKYLEKPDYLIPEALINSKKLNPDTPLATGCIYDSLRYFLDSYNKNQGAQDKDETNDTLSGPDPDPGPGPGERNNAHWEQQDNKPILSQQNTIGNGMQPIQLAESHTDHSQETRIIPFKCSECSKEFKSKQSLKLHKRLHLKEKPYPCDMCNKCFPHEDNLKAHKRTHTSERPFKCSECDKKFRRKNGLDVHINIHTRAKIFLCRICSKQFAQKSNLIKHMHTHNTRKKIPCRDCNKSFYSKAGLKNHESVHTGIQPYTCPTCFKKFRRKDYLKSHISSAHNNKSAR